MNDEELLALVRGGQRERARRERNRTKGLRRRMLASSKIKRCRWCRCLLTNKTATTDHVIPICEGGKTTKDNCVWACQECNEERGRLANPTNKQVSVPV